MLAVSSGLTSRDSSSSSASAPCPPSGCGSVAASTSGSREVERNRHRRSRCTRHAQPGQPFCAGAPAFIFVHSSIMNAHAFFRYLPGDGSPVDARVVTELKRSSSRFGRNASLTLSSESSLQIGLIGPALLQGKAVFCKEIKQLRSWCGVARCLLLVCWRPRWPDRNFRCLGETRTPKWHTRGPVQAHALAPGTTNSRPASGFPVII